MNDTSAQAPTANLNNFGAGPAHPVQPQPQAPQHTQYVRPTKGEGAVIQTIIENTTPAEVTTQTPEKPPAPETVKPEIQTIVPTNPQLAQTQDDNTQNVVTNQKPAIKAVVDMRTGHETLKKISPGADEITTIADQDEAEFIEEVLEHHPKTD